MTLASTPPRGASEVRPARAEGAEAVGTGPAGVGSVGARSDGAGARRRGTTRIAPRALNGVVRAIAAESLGVTAKAASVSLSDVDGLLAIQVASSLAVDLDRSLQGGPTVRQAAELAQQNIAERTTALTGSTVGRVIVRITGCEFVNDRRVS